jgi:hypothetical protein
MHLIGTVSVAQWSSHMTHEEAMSIASDYVRKRYSFAPPIILVQHVIHENLEDTLVAVGTTWLKMPGSSAWRKSIAHTHPEPQGHSCCKPGQAGWIVGFFMSWDTDAIGMPQTLMVAIDDITGETAEIAFSY